MERFNRALLLIGDENLEKLKKASVAVFGVGGVGGYAVESLVRSGVGKITVFDNDTVALSNINRQIIATEHTLGKDKVEAVKDRLLAINPNLNIVCNKVFYLPENAGKYPLNEYDYIIDAVDTVSAKIEIITRAKKAGVPVISCMGTGGKTDPTALKVADIEKTKGCPLARVMRRELKSRGIKEVKIVYSEEIPVNFNKDLAEDVKNGSRKAPSSMIFVPASAGILLAREVVFDIIKRS